MADEYQREIDLLAVGLTKPSTKLGVPFAPFFMSILIAMFGWMLFQSLTHITGIGVVLCFVSLWVVMYLAMFFLTSRDVFGLKITWINLIYFRPHATRAIWGNTDSYAS